MQEKLTHIVIFMVAVIASMNCTTTKKSTTVTNDLYKQVKANFRNPEASSGVNCWWWWLNGNVNKATITKDLEAMKSRNFQGAMIFDAGGHNQRGNLDIPAGPLFGSADWNKLFVFALGEARRLGLDVRAS